jgi:hypothetical protein
VQRLLELHGPGGATGKEMLRDAAPTRLVGGVKNADRPGMRDISDRIDDALQGRGAKVMETLFSEPEPARMSRVASELRDIAAGREAQPSA